MAFLGDGIGRGVAQQLVLAGPVVRATQILAALLRGVRPAPDTARGRLGAGHGGLVLGGGLRDQRLPRALLVLELGLTGHLALPDLVVGAADEAAADQN